MAAFVLFVAVAGAAVVADLAWENPTAGQLTVFHHTVSGYPEGWLLAIAAGLGFVVALVLVTSVNSTKGRRARRKQLVRLRPGLEDHMVAPEPDHARLLDAFFGPEVPSRHLGGPARPVDLLGGERPESRTGDDQRWLILEPIQHPTEPLYQQTKSANVREEGREGRAEDDQRWVTGDRVEYPPSRSTSRPGGPLACARTGISQSRPARGAGASGARRGWRRQGAATTRWSRVGAIGPTAPG